MTLLTDEGGSWWIGRLAVEGADAHRSLTTSLVAVPLTYLSLSFMHPCPVAWQPPIVGVAFFTFLFGWVPVRYGGRAVPYGAGGLC